MDWQCPAKGDTPYFTSVQFWMLRRALQAHRQGQKTFPPTYWKQLYTTAIKEGPTLRMAKSTEATKPVKPDMKKCSLPQLGSYVTKTFLSQGIATNGGAVHNQGVYEASIDLHAINLMRIGP